MINMEETIAELRLLVEQLREVIKQQALEIEQLKVQLAKANKDSSTSSRPPSSDIVAPPKAKRDRRKKPKIGAQHGHKRALRKPLPPQRVDEVIDHTFDDREIKARQLIPTGNFQTFQHAELQDLPIHVTETRRHEYVDPAGKLVYPDVPGWNRGPIFGPRMLATIGYLKSRCHCSYTTIEGFIDDVLNVPVSRGYLAKLCNGVISDSLAQAHEELKAALPSQEQIGSDESSLKNNGRIHWVWCLTAATFTVFHIANCRARRVLEELIGETFLGCLNCGYFSANLSFTKNFPARAQFCWAHLIRDIRFLTKQPCEQTRQWAEQLLDRSHRMFVAWHDRESMSADGFHRSMMTHRRRLPGSNW